MACNYCFPTQTIFQINSEFEKEGTHIQMRKPYRLPGWTKNNNNNRQNGSFERVWLPHRGTAQMACNYCFPTGTIFQINSEFEKEGTFR